MMFGFHGHSRHRHAGPRHGGFGFGPGGGRFGGGPFGGGDWGDGEGRGPRRRVFDGGELRLLLLALLEAAPRHGYDLIRDIEQRTGGAYAPSPGVVYPTLTMLDELGHVDELKEDGARKRFTISPAGLAHLTERREAADALVARLEDLGRHRARSDRAPISRAIANLHLALRNASGDPSAERQDAIVAILDEATRQVERVR